MGRKKIAISKIQSKSVRMVTFTKRRQGLFKKAGDISILCGLEIAVLTFSPAGRPFSFGYPSVDSVLARFGFHTPAPLVGSSPSSSRPVDGSYWWEADFEKAEEGTLLRAKIALEELKENVCRRLTMLSLCKEVDFQVDSSPRDYKEVDFQVGGRFSGSDSWEDNDLFDSLPQLNISSAGDIFLV